MTTFPYQPYYCEENIWRLFRLNPFDGDQVHAIVIANAEGACPMWNQRACPSPARPIFWDYHVVAVESLPDGDRLWDLDTRLDCPAPFDLWWKGSFPAIDGSPAELSPSFRVISRQTYLETLSSDRSHMEIEDGGYEKTPPSWEPIYDDAVGMNLDKFIDPEASFVGDVLSPDELLARFGDSKAVDR